jgi:hypothetical protein
MRCVQVKKQELITMEKNVDEIIKDIQDSALDKPTATLLVSAKSDKLFFIGEALLVATGVALLHSYLSGLIGAEKLGESHRVKIKTFWKKIWAGDISEKDNDEAKKLAESMLRNIDEATISLEGKRKAEKEIEKMLLDEGATNETAAKVATAITHSLFIQKWK